MFKKSFEFGTFATLMTVNLFCATPSWSQNSEEQSATSAENAAQIPMEDVQRFSIALGLIKQYYIKSAKDDALFDNAIRGMLSGLDPHSGYLNEEDFKELQASTNGEFAGLGMEVTMEDGVIKVITPLVDSPAAKAGIKTGDYIIKLDTKVVQGLDLKQAVNLMRGTPGSSISLTILRKGEKAPLVFNVERQNIAVQSVKSKLLDNQYGYVRLAQFQASTDKDMEKAIKKLAQDAGGRLKGLVLDLRNNPGGLLDSAIQVSDAFLSSDKNKNEIIVYTEGRLPGSKFTAYANPGDILNNAPMVVLINNGSASASEIVAGALKDNHRAIILGNRSFGKGSVQTVLPLDNTHGIKLTTALYFTPSGKSIQAEGITPDIVIEEYKVAKNNESNPLSGFSEAELSGHLQNGNIQPTKIADTKTSVTDTNLANEDYQLYAALNVLKGLAVASNH